MIKHKRGECKCHCHKGLHDEAHPCIRAKKGCGHCTIPIPPNPAPKEKQKRVLCFACKKPIHIDELGGVKKINDKEAWFHNKVTCLITVAGSYPTPNPAPEKRKKDKYHFTDIGKQDKSFLNKI